VQDDLSAYFSEYADPFIEVALVGSAQEFVGRAGIAELGLNSQFADG
jgi:hypothetical protein